MKNLSMNYYSLNKISPDSDFKSATLLGQAPDKGLYFPKTIPKFDPGFLLNLKNLPDDEIAFRVIKEYVGDSIPGSELKQIVAETLSFPIPLVNVKENIF